MAHLLDVQGLHTQIDSDRRRMEVLQDVSFYVDEGETVCLVGESSCGKSMTALSLMGLLPRGGRVTAGQALFEGQDLLALPERALDRLRGDRLSMVFQDALSSLDPVFSIGDQLCEGLRAHRRLTRAEARRRAAELLAMVELPHPEAMLQQYPHTLSGGQRQRVLIAMALACGPRLLIADEPTTALDVTIQAQILALLRRLQQQNHMSLLLVTHDLGIVAQVADRVLVMYAGQIVESAPVQALFDQPAHPYTRALLQSIPRLSDRTRLQSIAGTVPENYPQISGCRFAGRCPQARPACDAPQALHPVGPLHEARCWQAAEVRP